MYAATDPSIYDPIVLHLDEGLAYSDAVTLRDRDGSEISLNNEEGATVVFKQFPEYPSNEAEGTASGDADGKLSISITMSNPGIFIGQITLTDRAKRLPIWASVEPDLANLTDRWDVLTVSSVRDRLLDRGADDNELIGMVQWSDGEICRAVFDACRRYLNTPPTTIGIYYPQAFPWPDMLLIGTQAYLYINRGTQIERNKKTVRVPGLATDFQARGQLFLKIGYQLLGQFENEACIRKKILDVDNCYGYV